MKKNMSHLDQILRIIIAAAVAALSFIGILSTTWAIVLGIIAVIFLLTGLTGFCLLYKLFGLSTLKKSWFSPYNETAGLLFRLAALLLMRCFEPVFQRALTPTHPSSWRG